MTEDQLAALERVWHLALSRAEDKHAAYDPTSPEAVADIEADGSALDVTRDLIGHMGGEV